jgi:tripartite ATP-independent transporter DctP family solute receptor
MKKLLVVCFMCFGMFTAFAPQHVFAAQKIKVVLASSLDSDPENYANMTMKELMERANKYSDNAFDFQVFPSMQLGDEQETVRAMQLGTIQISLVATNNFAVFAPSTGWVNMPYLFNNLEEFRNLVDAMWVQNNEWAVKEANCRYLTIQDVGYRQLTTGPKYPVRKLNDAKGIKIRTPQNPLMVATFKALGLEPTAVAFSETFNALQQGVVDGQEGCFNNVVSLKFYEAQKYATEINYSVHSSGFLAAEPWLRSLTEKQRDALIRAGREAMEFERTKVAWILENDNKRMKDNGMTLLGVVSDLPEWIRLGRTAWPKCYEVIGRGDGAKGKQIVDLVLSKKK